MTRVLNTKTNFTGGEIARDLLGRGDLKAYENGAATLRNVVVAPTGGVKRRAGTQYLATLPGACRLIAFDYNATTTYLLAFSNLRLDVFQDGVSLGNIAAPWTSAQLDQISFTQSADTLLVTHPDVPPKRVNRSTLGAWTISDFVYVTDATGNKRYEPFYKFAASPTTLTASAASGSVTLTASASTFSASYVGIRLRYRGSDCTITAYTNPTTVTATVHGTFSGTAASTDWSEQAFSPLRGYPVAIACHQDRLVLGGSRELPNRLWLSRSGTLYNFDLGTGLDDDSIEFGIVSDQINAIRAVFSSRHLQVFTSGGEWMVTGDPLTPISVQLKRQTRVGSVVSRQIAPLDVDGATLFVARNLSEIREFLYTDLEQAYQSTDLALLARHVIITPIDQAYDRVRRLFYVTRADGKIACLTMYRAENVAAWSVHDTMGLYKSALQVGDRTYVQVQRGASYFLEEICDDFYVDAGLAATAGAPQTVWSGLTHLNGYTVKIIADGVPVADKTVVGGAVTLDTAATNVQIGLAFTHKIEPLPPPVATLPGAVHKMRLIRVLLKLLDTSNLRLDLGGGYQTRALPSTLFSGDLMISGIGWRRDFDDPLWKIESDAPQPFTLLSLSTETKVN